MLLQKDTKGLQNVDTHRAEPLTVYGVNIVTNSAVVSRLNITVHGTLQLNACLIFPAVSKTCSQKNSDRNTSLGMICFLQSKLFGIYQPYLLITLEFDNLIQQLKTPVRQTLLDKP